MPRLTPAPPSRARAAGRPRERVQRPKNSTNSNFRAAHSHSLRSRGHPDGTLDTTFGTGGLAAREHDDIDFGGRIALAPDGTIYMAGEEEDEDPTLFTFERDGRSVGASRLPYLGDTADVDVGPDGRVVIVGNVETRDPATDLDHDDLVVKYLPGARAIFQTDVLGQSHDRPFGVAVAPDGDVLVAGAAADISLNDSPVLLRYRSEAFAVPQVEQAWVGGTEWTQAFRNYLARDAVSGLYGRAMFDGRGFRRSPSSPGSTSSRSPSGSTAR